MERQDDILSYREMCEAENVQTLQRGMNFRMNPRYSVILMSQRKGAPYKDKIHEDGITIEYEGHDVSRKSSDKHPKTQDQPERLPSGKLTQNGLFIQVVNLYKLGKESAELVKVYEKVFSGVWSLKGYFDLVDVNQIKDGFRKVYRFVLKVSDRKENLIKIEKSHVEHTRLIPSEIKREVWKRDKGICVICGDNKNLHFDHVLPFSKGGTSLSVKNVRLLCLKHNLQKSAKIE